MIHPHAPHSPISRGHFINGQWSPGAGAEFSRVDPAEGRLTWQGRASAPEEIDRAVSAATRAAPAWARLPLEQRALALDSFTHAVIKHRDDFRAIISLETGRPRWEVQTECDALIGKTDLTKKAFRERRGNTSSTRDGITSATRYKPLGTLAVLGPFNLPAHLPNGHIIPALLAGNTVVFKPSELTPGTGELYARCWEQANLPAGVFNLIQGGREQGAALATHPAINGVLFTGSRTAGVALCTALAAFPEKLIALEMGGNNPLLATGISNLDAAAYTIIQSAFITSGQRCTCARRLILLQNSEGDRILERVITLANILRVGPPSLEPEPFMGPVITEAAGEKLLAAQRHLVAQGARSLLDLRTLGSRPALLSPGIVDVTPLQSRADEEYFGPLLQVIRVPNFDAALAAANDTRFGLAAALLSDDAALYEKCLETLHAGIINWNRPTTGASSALPFGGVGASGNHRPAGAFSVDYTNDPVASLETSTLTLPDKLLPGIAL